MPAARAACVTLPVASRLVRKSLCRSGVQRTGSTGRLWGGIAPGAGGLGPYCSIDKDRSDEILFWKGKEARALDGAVERRGGGSGSCFRMFRTSFRYRSAMPHSTASL